MRSAVRTLVAFGFLLLAPACATRSAAGRRVGADRNLITREQILEHRFNNAYEAVQALHSNWLATRGPDSFQNPSQVWVYLDNTRLGGVETLREIGSVNIGSIRYYDGVAATARWGLDHGSGVIFVTTRLG
jgi:hypothetical protein